MLTFNKSSIDQLLWRQWLTPSLCPDIEIVSKIVFTTATLNRSLLISWTAANRYSTIFLQYLLKYFLSKLKHLSSNNQFLHSLMSPQSLAKTTLSDWPHFLLWLFQNQAKCLRIRSYCAISVRYINSSNHLQVMLIIIASCRNDYNAVVIDSYICSSEWSIH